ncbi:hypothetical protein DLM77_11810 [Leptospira yasudae]|uniref:Uncharacterized protein n=1 Tax=Leptospira yasudae TaxID=2202201 RepID=A0ABX9M293_9LEPT|nr:hypothetical protein DLM77_11810 [Leptospira yasudae]
MSSEAAWVLVCLSEYDRRFPWRMRERSKRGQQIGFLKIEYSKKEKFNLLTGAESAAANSRSI